MGRRALAGMAVWVLLVWSGVSWAAPAPASEVRLTADQLRFDPATERIEATGNVRLLKGGADLRALKGQGFLEGLHRRGPVSSSIERLAQVGQGQSPEGRVLQGTGVIQGFPEGRLRVVQAARGQVDPADGVHGDDHALGVVHRAVFPEGLLVEALGRGVVPLGQETVPELGVLGGLVLPGHDLRDGLGRRGTGREDGRGQGHRNQEGSGGRAAPAGDAAREGRQVCAHWKSPSRMLR